MRPTCVLFDLDGTLIDHFTAIYRCHVHAMRQLGLPEPTMAQVRAAVGGGLEEAIAKLAGADKVAALRPHFLAHWQATNLDDAELLPGALEILQALRAAGVPRAVLTNKRGYAAREVCAHLGLTPLLDGIFGAEDTPWIKPHPDFTRHALTRLKVGAPGTTLVGDSPFDVATALQSQLGFIGVTTGTHTADELRASGATAVFDHLGGVSRELGL
jgi:phosphoglycolate phosphatase